ncbi:unnamed protein product [Mytilus edulis]|uniref:Transposase Helix-turn-helix domain-containing protein n=1 Tax=Mytilus edulis TaxID=6550 RepID=A0A8S3TU95_MYTED|nr:unnamed protein product [Mytilus edulis]
MHVNHYYDNNTCVSHNLEQAIDINTWSIRRFKLIFEKNEEGINPVNYKEKRKEVKAMLLTDQLLLVLCRLRNGLHIKDLAYRFNIKPKSVSVIFKSVILYMYLKLGYLSYWPHRDTIIQNMPQQYKQEFPICLAIIDCTEFKKTEKPSSLKSQDPRGSVIFVSDLFSGSISDNEICKESGFYKLLQQLKDQGYLQDNNGIMANKEKDLGELNLRLNIPPFASTATQMSSGDVALTRKIAAHRIPIERKISKL